MESGFLVSPPSREFVEQDAEAWNLLSTWWRGSLSERTSAGWEIKSQPPVRFLAFWLLNSSCFGGFESVRAEQMAFSSHFPLYLLFASVGFSSAMGGVTTN